MGKHFKNAQHILTYLHFKEVKSIKTTKITRYGGLANTLTPAHQSMSHTSSSHNNSATTLFILLYKFLDTGRIRMKQIAWNNWPSMLNRLKTQKKRKWYNRYDNWTEKKEQKWTPKSQILTQFWIIELSSMDSTACEIQKRSSRVSFHSQLFSESLELYRPD